MGTPHQPVVAIDDRLPILLAMPSHFAASAQWRVIISLSLRFILANLSDTFRKKLVFYLDMVV
jgi:hypothetical protein